MNIEAEMRCDGPSAYLCGCSWYKPAVSEYEKVYVLIVEETCCCKIEGHEGVLEIRTAARDVWMSPATIIGWVNGRGSHVRTLENIR